MSSFVKNLDTPLLCLSHKDVFTLRDACAEVRVFGRISAGKASGSSAIRNKNRLCECGGLAIAIKSEDLECWRRYARKSGRGDALVFPEAEE